MMQRIQKRAPIASQAVLELLTIATIGAPSDDIFKVFRQIDTDTVNLILQRASLPVARFLLSISAHEGHDFTEVATRWLVSDNVDDVLAAVDALRCIGTLKARQQIATTADHKDYKVRREVIKALSANATEEEEKLILARAYDRSAPIREKVAEIIGDMQWRSGLQLLLHLLRDRRDYTRHPEYNIRVEREYKVARTAAKSLDKFKPLPIDVVDNILAFVEAGQEASSDVELHVELVNVLASVPDSRVVITLCKLLDDDRVIGGKGENLYPVRYSAAWGLCHYLHSFCQEDEVNLVDWDAVERGALHVDPQLAAPCLCLLGMQLTNPTPGLLTALRSNETSETRRVLALLMMDDFSLARENAMKYGLLSATHPFLAHEKPSATNDWPVTKPLEAWLRSLDKDKDVEGVVLKIAASHMKIDLDIDDFDATALRRTPKPPITTTSEMFGME